MRIIYHYNLKNERGLSKFLEKHQVSHEVYIDHNQEDMCLFDLYEDHVCYRKFKWQFPIASLGFSTVGVEYSKEEVEVAEWLTVSSVNQKVNWECDENAWEFSCARKRPFSKEASYRHIRQVGPFSASKGIKWRSRDFFCGPNSPQHLIFCANKTKEILGKEWLGLEFWPVKRENHTTNILDLNQLHFNQILPFEAIHFTGKERIKSCNSCGRKKVQITEKYQLSLKKSHMKNPKNVYTTDDIWTFEKTGWDTFSLNIVSHEFYQLCEDNGMNRGMIYEPIELI